MNYMGKIAYDKQAKEYVLITNGICTLRHDTPEHFAEDHANGTGSCHYEPSEAIAVRTMGLHKGKPVIGWTYRGVQYSQLSCSDDMQHMKAEFNEILQKRTSAYFIGRV